MATQWEYKSIQVTLYGDGQFRIQDLDEHKAVLTDQGWEYIDMRILPAKSSAKAEVVLRFRRRVIRSPPAAKLEITPP